MATGCMATKISGKLKHHCTLLGILSLFVAVEGVAQEVGLAGVMGNKALLMINGGDPQTVPVGQVLDGVKVLSIQGDQVMSRLVAGSAHCVWGSTPLASAGAMVPARS